MQTCRKCMGSGKCNVCNGSGKWIDSKISGSKDNPLRKKNICPFCHGGKICSDCKGKGKR